MGTSEGRILGELRVTEVGWTRSSFKFLFANVVKVLLTTTFSGRAGDCRRDLNASETQSLFINLPRRLAGNILGGGVLQNDGLKIRGRDEREIE